MAVAVRSTARSTGSSAASCTVTKPSGTAADDALVALLYRESGTAITGPAGWSNDGEIAVTTSNFWLSLWSKRASSEGANYVWSWTGSVWQQGEIYAVSGAETSGSFYDASPVSAQRNDSSSRLWTNSSIDTVSDQCLVVWMGAAFVGVSASGLTQPTNFSIDLNGSGTSGEDVVGASLAGNGIGTILAKSAAYDAAGGNGSTGSWLVAIKPPTSPPPGPTATIFLLGA